MLAESPEATTSGAVSLPPSPSSLEFENIAVAYENHRTILSGISFSIPAGKTVGIVGTSGSGKSTIIRLLMRLIEPNVGRILLDGQAIDTLSLTSLRRAIALVPQDTILLDESIGFNISLGREGFTQDDIERAAGLAHLHELITTLRDGYATLVGPRGVKLSGGERQRVAIARAALLKPAVYVFDEATSSLDSETEAEIMNNLRDLAEKCTTMIIAHRLSTIVHADGILVIEKGRIVESGTHAALLRRCGQYAKLWESQHSNSHRSASESSIDF